MPRVITALLKFARCGLKPSAIFKLLLSPFAMAFRASTSRHFAQLRGNARRLFASLGGRVSPNVLQKVTGAVNWCPCGCSDHSTFLANGVMGIKAFGKSQWGQ